MANDTVSKPARTIQVHAHHLPVSCPIPGTPHWEGHPHVDLDVLRTGEATCPYCNTSYVFVGEKPHCH